MKKFTIIISVCSVEAANNVQKILTEESINYAVRNKVSLYCSSEKKKTKDGADVIISTHDGNFLFVFGVELGLKMHTLCPHNVNCKQYAFQNN